MTLQEKLKTATRESHDTLEQVMHVNEIMQKTLNKQQYEQILLTNYLVHRAYEDKIFSSLPETLKSALNPDSRKKLAALKKDINEAGIDIPQEITSNTAFSSYAGIGAMYVLEGATLGGNVIYKKLSASEEFQDLQLHYYQIYGERLMPNWISFVQVINTIDEVHHEEVIEGAISMFGQIKSISEVLSSSKP